MLRHLLDTILKKHDEIVEPMTFYKKRHEQLKKNPLSPLRFFTAWALILHVLHYIGLFPFNTYAVALFVLTGSAILFWVFPGYYPYLHKLGYDDPESPYYELTQNKYRYITMLFPLDLMTHVMPLFVLATVPITTLQWLESIAVLIVMLFSYFMIYGLDFIWNLYYYILDPVHSEYLK